MNLDRQTFSIDFAGKPLTLEVSKIAEQATVSVLGKYEETEILVTAVMEDQESSANYLPLIVDYEERFYAAGKIIGSRFIRREGRPSDEAILSGRIIDRTIRPLFDHRLRRRIQVVITILAIDEKSDPDFISLITASTALAISEIPWDGPVAGVKIMIDKKGKSVVNPGNIQSKDDFELLAFIAGTEDKMNMIELEALEVSDKKVVEALTLAQNEIKKLIVWQKKIILKIGRTKADIPLLEPHAELKPKIRDFLAGKLESAVFGPTKDARQDKLAEIKQELKEFLEQEDAGDAFTAAEHFLEEEIDALVHKNILESDRRPDGRRLNQVRDLYAEAGLIKRTHGSALFMRGSTQALAVTTLGPPGAEQMVETIEFTGKKRFLLHYNFPAYSVGETGVFRGPGRREIGHGALASKSVRNLLPGPDEFPYTIRVVSEILSSNGSSSMATVCATSLSLMDAGVPIKKPVAGIAMGLIMGQATSDKRQETPYKILTDIQGPEDHYGDMDFKVAGTRDGVTAIQMDVKINGITPKIAGEILAQAREALDEILPFLDKVLDKPRPNISPYAPIIVTVDIPPAKIGEIIGPGGKIINKIIADTGALSIDIEEDGRVFITAEAKEKANAALETIRSMARVYKVGGAVEGRVVKILDFGAIVEIGPYQDGMIHVSELKDGFVKNVSDVVKLGDIVKARIIRVDPDGKIGLSLKHIEGGK